MSELEKALTEEQSTKLINEILDNDEQPSDNEIRLLQRRIADAGFVKKRVSVNRRIVGRSFGGIELRSRSTSLIAHTAKRVLVDRK